ncbi:MAG: glycine cleavage system protein GcvH [Ezakiella sp.]|nr:glycine cleavage system protein GcvH [Ezakiella sp.]MDD7472293.1 glycine cleavage system protein GcvH [Bacillota bacterium]MDY3923031.1 glycine cleavage system protein GcvH [Ezakiella sp.]
MEVRKGYYYTKDHEWLSLEGDVAACGICDYAQHHLGEIVYVELPSEDDEFAQGDSVAAIESTKAASDLFAPLAGTVTEVNEELEDAPELLNEKPYDAWICKMTLEDPDAVKELMTAEEYEKFLSEEA